MGKSSGYSKAEMDNRSNQMNPNNDAYWSSRYGNDDYDDLDYSTGANKNPYSGYPATHYKDFIDVHEEPAVFVLKESESEKRDIENRRLRFQKILAQIDLLKEFGLFNGFEKDYLYAHDMSVWSDMEEDFKKDSTGYSSQTYVKSPLLCAIKRKREDIAVFLIQNGAYKDYIEFQNLFESNPSSLSDQEKEFFLDWILDGVSTRYAEFPFPIGSSIQESPIKDFIREYPLDEAIKSNQREVVSHLLDSDINLVRMSYDKQSNHPLRIAVLSGNANLAQKIIDLGFTPDSYTDSYDSLINMAIRKGHLDIVKCLVENGVTFLGQDFRPADKPPIMVALETNQLCIVNYFLSKSKEMEGANGNQIL